MKTTYISNKDKWKFLDFSEFKSRVSKYKKNTQCCLDVDPLSLRLAQH